jgi:hypothetical protein
MIKPMLERIGSSTDSTIGPPVLREKGVSTLVRELKCQIELFWNGEYPFHVVDVAKVTDPLAWWHDIGRQDGAKVLSVSKINYCNHNENFIKHYQILAIRIFSVLVNSMPDERTNSTITWFNSPIHGNQMMSTLVDMIKVGQWYGKHNVVSSALLKRR